MSLLGVLKILVFCGGALWLGLAAYLYFGQDRMVFLPSHANAGNPADAGLEHEEVWLSTETGTKIHAWWLPHPQARATLLFCHGNAGNITHRLESLRIFHRLRLNVLIFDYSGYGRSTGRPSEGQTYADARAAWEHLVHEREIPSGDILIFGRPLGGGVASWVASWVMSGEASGVTSGGASRVATADQPQNPLGLILESTFISVPEVAAQMYPYLPIRKLARHVFPSLRRARTLGLPALVIHSPEDDVIPYNHGRALYATLPGPKSFLKISGNHNTGFLFSEPDYSRGIDNWLRGLGR